MSARARRYPIGAALVCGLLFVGISAGGGNAPAPRVLGEQLIAGPCGGPSFCISSPAVGPVLYPGAAGTGNFPLSITNPLSVDITVTLLTVTVTSALPSGCAAATNFTLNGTAFSAGPTPQVSWAPLQMVTHNSTSSVTPIPTLQLVDTNVNQQACQHLSLSFGYSGSARYTVSTATNLASGPNPASVSQNVTLTATVSSSVTPSGAGHTPVGSVAFDQCTNPSCSTFVSIGSGAVNGSGVATTTTSFGALGSYKLYAVFTPTDSTDFVTSTSPTITQQVSTVATSSSLVSTLNPSKYGRTVSFTDTVTSSAGTPAGNVTFYDGASIVGTGTLNASGKATLATSALSVGTHQISAGYAGNGTYQPSTSSTVSQVVNYTSCITGAQNSGLTVPSGQAICVTSSGRVNGGVTVQSGGLFYVNGGVINGGITVQSGGSLYVSGGSINGNVSATGAKALTVCGANPINGYVSASGSTGFVLIGDAADDGSPACAANNINNYLTLTNNTGGVEVGGNTINGPLTLTGNSGSGPGAERAGANTKPEIEANHINGNLVCTTNAPAPTNDGKTNTVNGSRTGQCTGF